MAGRTLSRLAAGALVLTTPTVAFAHAGAGAADSVAHGFMHPLAGVDHVLAMVLVGVLAAQMGGRAVWLVPAAFVAVMALGGGLAMAGTALPFVETGIVLSVVALGALVAFGVRLPVVAAMAVAGAFALFHGHAHGAEMAAGTAGLAYGAGFVAATALLHGAGVGASALFGRTAMRTAGGLAAIAGVALLAAIA